MITLAGFDIGHFKNSLKKNEEIKKKDEQINIFLVVPGSKSRDRLTIIIIIILTLQCRNKNEVR